MSDRVRPVPEGYSTITPYLIVSDADALLDFVTRAFDASVLSRHETPDGRVAHAEFSIGDSRVMLGEAQEAWPPMSAMLHLYVEDADAVFARAIEAGAEVVRELEDTFYGDRSGGVKDAAGNLWWIATRIEEVSRAEATRRQAAAQGNGGD